ncbi:MAG: hypothetical protein AMJ62_12050 [Myxococcales bacterium SG8_38]|nr:MAG: hypothetical protein AMJ62_12050 [Myxococcales bacterium SG8_38]
MLILLGLSLWAVFQVMAQANHGYALGLGNLGFPSYRFVAFTMFYGLLGGAGALCIAVGWTRGFSAGFRGEARWFLIAATALGVLIPVLIRSLVLAGGVVADDESVYRFSAELLASGRLTAPSHPLKLFFDHAFMVNDGRMFSQYFLGWPAIMALGVPFGATGYVNALVSGATVPALYQLLKTVSGVTWARLGVLVFLTSPMIQMAAATAMSHTSALGALVYAMWLATLALRGGGRATHFGFGLALSVAFFIRPASAIGVALPWGLLWMWTQLKNRAFRNILWFAIPTFLLSILFLLVNLELTGSVFGVAYRRAFQYAIENGLRFSHVAPQRAGATVMMASGGLPEMLTMTTVGLLRLNMSLFGWPLSLGLVPLAIALRPANWWWASFGTYVLTHLAVFDAGIDTFGPTHWFELALPVLVLSMLGCQRATRWATQISPSASPFPRNLALTFVTASVLLFTPYRLKAVSQIGSMTRRVPHAVEQADLHNAVIFVNRPWAPTCNSGVAFPPRHFVFWWPVNDPDFSNDIIWANHLSVEQDRRLLASFPGRQGYITRWNERLCEVDLVPLEEAARLGFPNGHMGIAPYTDDHPPTGERPD